MSTAVLEMPAVTSVMPSLTYPTSPSTNPKRDGVQKRVQSRINTIYDHLFDNLKQQYQLLDEKRVFAFLRQHNHLIHLLLEGRGVVAEIFGEDTPVLLHIQRDPDVGLEYLIAWIRTGLDADEAVDRLMDLNEAWFIDRADLAGELLSFNLGVA